MNSTIQTKRYSDKELDTYHNGRAAYLARCKATLSNLEAQLAGDIGPVEATAFSDAQSAEESRAEIERQAAICRGAIEANR